MITVRRILRSIAILLGMAMLLVSLSAPASAHKEHKKKKPVAAQAVQPGVQPTTPTGKAAVAEDASAEHAGAAVEHGHGSIMEGMDMEMDRSNTPFLERLLTWFGRLHPLVVYFPIAFFPAALFTAIVGRRRPAFSAPVQFLVVAGGIFAPLAAAAGWLAGMSTEPEPILAYHRWLGVVIGIAGAGLGIWAWKRPWEDRGAGMILALTVMTTAIAVQGFLGAAVTHGMDHLMF
jgi:uncharacterized membrane protein